MAEILLVDSDKESLRLKEQALRRAGFGVVTMPTGEMALEYLEQNLPDAIVADTRDDVFDGFDLVKVLRDKFRPDLLTSTDALKAKFHNKLEIASQHESLRGVHFKVPVILTSKEPLQEWPWKQYAQPPHPKQWEIDNAETLHYSSGLSLADKDFVVRPYDDIPDLHGIEDVISFLRYKLGGAAKEIELDPDIFKPEYL